MKVCFDPWGDLPMTESLVSAIKKAQSAKLKPTALDIETQSAEFEGSSGNYLTTLSSCMTTNGKICGGLNQSLKKHEPCKHILRLAMELGLIYCEFDSSEGKTVHPRGSEEREAEENALRGFVRDIELHPDLMPFVYKVFQARRYGSYTFCEDVRPLSPLFETGVLKKAEDYLFFPFFLNQKTCVDGLIEMGYAFPDELVYKKDKFAYAKAHAAEISALYFPNAAEIDCGDPVTENRCQLLLEDYLFCRLNHETYDTGEVRDIDHFKNRIVRELLIRYDPVYKYLSK